MKSLLVLATLSLLSINSMAGTISISDKLNGKSASSLKSILSSAIDKSANGVSVNITNLSCSKSAEVALNVVCKFVEDGRQVELNLLSNVKSTTLYNALLKAKVIESSKRTGSLIVSKITVRSIDCYKDMSNATSCTIIQ